MPAWVLILFILVLGASLSISTALYAKIVQVDRRLTELRGVVSPLWSRIQSQIASQLHHPHPRYAEMDTLLELLEMETIDAEGRARLKDLLAQRSVDMHEDISPSQRSAAALMSL